MSRRPRPPPARLRLRQTHGAASKCSSNAAYDSRRHRRARSRQDEGRVETNASDSSTTPTTSGHQRQELCKSPRNAAIPRSTTRRRPGMKDTAIGYDLCRRQGIVGLKPDAGWRKAPAAANGPIRPACRHARRGFREVRRTEGGTSPKSRTSSTPSIGTRRRTPSHGVWMMRSGDDKIVARRLRQVLSGGASGQKG